MADNRLGKKVARGAKDNSAGRVRPRLKVKALIYPGEKGGYVAVIPALPGCVTEAETRDELLANIREAVAGYLLCTPGDFEPEAGGKEEEIAL